MPSICTSPTPATRQLPLLVSAPYAMCLSLFYFPLLLYPPFPPYACIQVPVVPSGLDHHCSLCTSVPLSLHPCVCPASWHILVLGLIFWVSISHEGEEPGRLHSLVVARLAPLPTDTWPRRPHHPPPPRCVDCIPSAEFCRDLR